MTLDEECVDLVRGEGVGLFAAFSRSVPTVFHIDRTVVPSFEAWMFGTVWAPMIRPAHALHLHRIYDNRAARRRTKKRRQAGR